MPNNTFTTTTRRGFGGRLKSSFGGIIIGLIMVFGSIVLLWYNEGRAVKTAKGLSEGEEQIVILSEPVLDPSNEGKLVHFSGSMVTSDTLYDNEFGIKVLALKLRRDVEMYQWKEKSKSETKDKIGGGQETTTTYSYEQDWKEGLINSDNFHVSEGHTNPKSIAFHSYKQNAQNASIGEFKMSSTLLQRVGNYSDYNLDEIDQAKFPDAKIVGSGSYDQNNPSVQSTGGLYWQRV